MRRFALTLGALVLAAGVAMADEKPLDVTIRVVESPDAPPSAVTRTIELPPSAAAKARERSEHALDAANETRTDAQQTLQGVVEDTQLLDSIESTIDLPESPIDLPESPIDLPESPIDTSDTLLNDVDLQ